MSTDRSSPKSLSLARLDKLVPGHHLTGWVRIGAFVTLLSYLFVLGVGLAAGTKESTSLVSEVGVISACVLGLVLTRVGRSRIAAFAVLAAVWTELMASILKDGGYHSQATVVLPLIVLGAGLLLGSRWAWMSAVATALTSAGLVYWGNVVLGIGPLPVENQRHFVVVSASLLATAALVQVALRSFAEVLDAARRGQARAARLVEEAPDGMVVLDAQLRILDANPRAEVILGGSTDEVRGRPIAELLAPRSRDVLEQRFRRLVDAGSVGRPLRVESEAAGGRVVEVTARRRPDDSDRHATATVHMVLRDVSRQVAVEERAARLGRILEEAGNEVLIFERNTGAVVLLSRGARTSLGLDSGETPTSVDEIAPSLGPEGLARLGSELEELGGAPLRVRSTYRRADGETYPVEVEYLEGRLDDTPVIVGFAVDVSERDRAREEQQALQNQLEHAQRMEAIGHLAGGVAHDFNNLLTVIAVCGGELRDVVPAGSEHLLDDLLEAQGAGSKLTRQLLAFARRDAADPKPVDLAEAVRESSSLFRRLVDPAIQVELDLERHPRVLADRGQLEQILINLVANARDAVGTSGTIRIHVAEAERDGIGWARLTVSDTGMGMSPDVAERVFEPFFTTKTVGKGTGLGLSTVHGIVTQNGGRISVESRPGSGTEFEILWPLDGGAVGAGETEPGAASPGAPGVEGEVPPASARILIVEDNQAVGTLCRRALESDGHDVMTASDGREGLEVATEHLDEIDFVLTDIVMPEMTGPDMVRRLRASGLDVPVVFMSGYPDGHEAAIAEDRDSELLTKPFLVADLKGVVRRLLTRTASGGEG